MDSFVANFHKVSYEQFKKDCDRNLNTEGVDLRKLYDQIQIPSRSTAGSAGYDFHIPVPVCFDAMEYKVIPTGIRVQIQPGYFLMLVPRSGEGFKYGMRLANTVGIIDSDYFDADNEGHIMAKVSYQVNRSLLDGDRFMQGIFVPYGTAVNDMDADKQKRTGGFGSTGK